MIIEGNIFLYEAYYYVPYHNNGKVVIIRISTKITV